MSMTVTTKHSSHTPISVPKNFKAQISPLLVYFSFRCEGSRYSSLAMRRRFRARNRPYTSLSS